MLGNTEHGSHWATKNGPTHVVTGLLKADISALERRRSSPVILQSARPTDAQLNPHTWLFRGSRARKIKEILAHSDPRTHPSNRQPPPFGSETARNAAQPPEPQRTSADAFRKNTSGVCVCEGGALLPHTHAHAHKENTHQTTRFDDLIAAADQLRVLMRHWLPRSDVGWRRFGPKQNNWIEEKGPEKPNDRRHARASGDEEVDEDDGSGCSNPDVQSCQQLRLRVFHCCVIYNALKEISSTHNIITDKNLSGSISGAQTLFLYLSSMFDFKFTVSVSVLTFIPEFQTVSVAILHRSHLHWSPERCSSGEPGPNFSVLSIFPRNVRYCVNIWDEKWWFWNTSLNTHKGGELVVQRSPLEALLSQLKWIRWATASSGQNEILPLWNHHCVWAYYSCNCTTPSSGWDKASSVLAHVCVRVCVSDSCSLFGFVVVRACFLQPAVVERTRKLNGI